MYDPKIGSLLQTTYEEMFERLIAEQELSQNRKEEPKNDDEVAPPSGYNRYLLFFSFSVL